MEAQSSSILQDLNLTQLPFDKQIYCGPVPVSKGNFQNIKVLKENGFTHILLLLPTYEYEQLLYDPALPYDLPQLYKEGGLEVVHLPIFDGKVPKREQLAEALNQMIHKKPSSQYLIHCQGGIGRTGLVVACLAMESLKINPSDAMASVQEWVHPEACKADLQRKFLEEYYKEQVDALSIVEQKDPIPSFKGTPIPLELKGTLYVGRLPNVKEDPSGVFKGMEECKIQTVVVLLPVLEFLERTDQNLIKLYEENKLKVKHCPISDENVPEKEALDQLINNMREALSNGENIYMHCLSGIGRTGLVAACLMGKEFDLSCEEAISLVRSQYNKHAVEKPKQLEFVKEYLGK